VLSPIFLASLTIGLLLGVYFISTGVERDRPGGATRLALALPATAAFATVYGLVGYLLLRYAAMGTAAAVAIAVVAAATAAYGAVALVTRWAVPSAAADPVDPRYLLQGTPARVTRAIRASRDGEVSYELDGARYATSARSFDGSALDVGDEVVIDRVEDGIAYVEAWALVERRL
jgi:membrane protein implicated in regulation of membrane protease activity